MPEINIITIKAVAREARRLAEEHPDTTASCTYVHDVDGALEANCIVGKAMANLGIPLDVLLNRNGCSIENLAAMYEGWQAPEWLDVTAEDAGKTTSWLANLQGSQDNGYSWGQALAKADRGFVWRQLNI